VAYGPADLLCKHFPVITIVLLDLLLAFLCVATGQEAHVLRSDPGHDLGCDPNF